MRVSAQVDVNVGVEAAFGYYCDQSSLSEWCVGGRITEFEAITPPPKRVGSRYKVAYSAFGITLRCVAELTKLEPCKLSVKDMVSGDYESYHYEMHFTPISEDRTHMEMRVEAELPWGPLGRLAGVLGRPLVQRDIELGLDRFKAGAEARASRREQAPTAAQPTTGQKHEPGLGGAGRGPGAADAP